MISKLVKTQQNASQFLDDINNGKFDLNDKELYVKFINGNLVRIWNSEFGGINYVS